MSEIPKSTRTYLSQIGSKGGRAGTGKAKVRGNSAYYRRLAQGRVAGNSAQRRKAKRAAKRMSGK